MAADLLQRLRTQLAQAEADLKSHMASWEYAFAMGAGGDGSRNHPAHRKTRARTDQLLARCRDLQARLAEHEL
jgi:hypothetical protein